MLSWISNLTGSWMSKWIENADPVPFIKNDRRRFSKDLSNTKGLPSRKDSEGDHGFDLNNLTESCEYPKQWVNRVIKRKRKSKLNTLNVFLKHLSWVCSTVPLTENSHRLDSSHKYILHLPSRVDIGYVRSCAYAIDATREF